jgi:hypothetical protein
MGFDCLQLIGAYFRRLRSVTYPGSVARSPAVLRFTSIQRSCPSHIRAVLRFASIHSGSFLYCFALRKLFALLLPSVRTLQLVRH